MVKRNQPIPSRDADRLPTTNSGRNFGRETQRTTRIVTDELIHSLSGAYENERARQVGEWERVQASSARHAA
jgi:hypothetical protein